MNPVMKPVNLDHLFIVLNTVTGQCLGENARGKMCWVDRDSGEKLVFEYARQADDAIREIPRRMAKSIKPLRVVQFDRVAEAEAKGGAA